MGEVPSSVRQYASMVVAASTSGLASSSSACFLQVWRSTTCTPFPLKSPYAVVGFNRLKIQKNDSDVGLSYISDNHSNNLSCYKHLQALVNRLLVTGKPEDFLFSSHVGYTLAKASSELCCYG